MYLIINNNKVKEFGINIDIPNSVYNKEDGYYFDCLRIGHILRYLIVESIAVDKDNLGIEPEWLTSFEDYVEEKGNSSFFPTDLMIEYNDYTFQIYPDCEDTESDIDYLIEYIMYINCGVLRKKNAIIYVPDFISSNYFDEKGKIIRKKNTEPRDMVKIGTKFIGYTIYRVLDKSTSQSKNRRYWQYWMICERTELVKNCIRFFCNNRDMLPFILGKHGTNLMSFKTYVKKYMEAYPDSGIEMHPKIIFKLSAARKVDLPK